MDILNLYQELIIDHGTKPNNHRILENPTHTSEGYNPLCGDRIKLYLKIEKNRIQDACFKGSGCAISTASASIMTDMLKGKTQLEALTLFKNFKDLVTNSSDKEPTHELGKLLALSGVKVFPSRIKCATLVWHALNDALKTR